MTMAQVAAALSTELGYPVTYAHPWLIVFAPSAALCGVAAAVLVAPVEVVAASGDLGA